MYCSVMMVRDNWNCGRGAQGATAIHDVTNDLIYSLELFQSSFPGRCILSSFTTEWTLGELIIHKLVHLLFVCYNDTLKLKRRLSHFNDAGTINLRRRPKLNLKIFWYLRKFYWTPSCAHNSQGSSTTSFQQWNPLANPSRWLLIPLCALLFKYFFCLTFKLSRSG